MSADVLGIATPTDSLQQEWSSTLTFVNIRIHLLLNSEPEIQKSFSAITGTVLRHSKWKSSALHSSIMWHLIAFFFSY